MSARRPAVGPAFLGSEQAAVSQARIRRPRRRRRQLGGAIERIERSGPITGGFSRSRQRKQELRRAGVVGRRRDEIVERFLSLAAAAGLDLRLGEHQARILNERRLWVALAKERQHLVGDRPGAGPGRLVADAHESVVGRFVVWKVRDEPLGEPGRGGPVLVRGAEAGEDVE